MKKALLLLLSSCTLSGCCAMKASGDRYNVDYITPGMTKDQVVEIMRDPVECVKVDDEEVMMWKGACISLIEGKVAEKITLDSDDSEQFTARLRDENSRSVELVDEIFSANEREAAARSPASVKPEPVP